MTFNSYFTSPDTSRRGPSNHKRNTLRKQFIDVFGKQTDHGELLALDKPTNKVWFGIDDFGWPYARIEGSLSDWQLNGKPINFRLVYLNVSTTGRGDTLTNQTLDSEYTFQPKGVVNGPEYFCVCWRSPSSGYPGVNPVLFP